MSNRLGVSMSYQKIKEIIERNDSIVIYRHIHPDYDAIGSQLGLYFLIKENYYINPKYHLI